MLTSRRRRLIGLGVVLSAYPTLVMLRVLTWGGQTHLRDRFEPAQRLTDLDGAVRVTQLLDRMTWPWEPTLASGFPSGERLVRWQFLAQGLQWGGIYGLTRIFPPVLSLNLFVLVGWVLTGVAVFALGRRLRLPPAAAVAAAVIVQMLPAMPKMAANYTSYVYLCVPLFVVCRAIDAAANPGRRTIVWLAVALGGTAFFDPYWFMFSVAATLVVFVACPGPSLASLRAGPRSLRLAVGGALLLPPLFVVLLLTAAGSSTAGSLSRPVAVETARFVDAGLREPYQWFRSSFEGVGIVIGVLGFVAVVRSFRRGVDGRIRACAAVVVLTVLLSTRTGFDTPWFRVGSLAEYARFVMPGVRFFQRAGLIAEAMLCVFAAALVVDVVRWSAGRVRSETDGSPSASNGRARRWGAIVATCAVVVPVAEFAPHLRPVSRRWDDFAEMRAVLAEVDDPVLLAVPFQRHGRDWLELSMLDGVAAVNPLYSKQREEITALAASRGAEAFANHLAALGATHLLAVSGEDGYPVTYDFAAPWFVARTSLMLDSYGDPPEEVVLYEVHGDAAAGDLCDPGCTPGPEFEFLYSTNVLREQAADGSLTDDAEADGDDIWLLDDSAELQFSLRRLDTVAYTARIAVTVTNPCDETVDVEIERRGDTQSASLAPAATETFVLEVDSTTSTDVAVVTTTSSGCTIGGVDRPVTLRLAQPALAP